jgi:type IV pilus assembly protein PilP
MLILLAVGVLLISCKEEAPAPAVPASSTPAAPKPIQAQVTSATIPSASVKPPVIDFSLKKDPFKPFAVVVQPQQKEGKKGPRLGALPIHTYEVGQFKVIGIITGLKENRGLVVDPTGKPYVVKVGMTIGINEGRITRIASNYIEITESFSDGEGKARKVRTTLNLPRKESF